MATNIVITGANGSLGKALAARLNSEGFSLEPNYPGPYEVFALPRSALDVSRRNDVMDVFTDIEPTLVFNAAGLSNVELCEYQKWRAYLVNRGGAENQARACEKFGALFIYFGTDLIFDGMQKQPYSEEDPPNPLGIYGDTKLAGELVTMSHCHRFLIVRTGPLYGSNGDHLVARVRERLKNETSLAAHKDYTHQPTYVEDLVDATLHLVRVGQTGTWNIANGGSTDEHGLSRKLAQLLGHTDADVQVDVRGRAAMRPKNAVLSTRKLEQAGHRMRTWDEALGAFVMSLEATKP